MTTNLTSKPVRTLTLGTLTDLVELVPRLLGFCPADSLVVVVMDAGRVQVTARIDLPDVHAPEAVAKLAQLWRRFPHASSIILAYCEEHERGWANLFGLDDALPDIDRVLIHVDGGRYYLEPCDQGTPYDADAGVMATRATAAGMAALASRDDLRTLLEPTHTPADLSAALDRVSTRTSTWSELVADAARLIEDAERGGEVGVDDATTLCLASHDPAFLDAVMLTTMAHNAEARRDLWAGVVRASVPRCAGFALAALALAAWLCGQGALQVVCMKEMEGQHADQYWIGILEHINADAVPPREWEPLRERLLQDEARGRAE